MSLLRGKKSVHWSEPQVVVHADSMCHQQCVHMTRGDLSRGLTVRPVGANPCIVAWSDHGYYDKNQRETHASEARISGSNCMTTLRILKGSYYIEWIGGQYRNVNSLTKTRVQRSSFPV